MRHGLLDSRAHQNCLSCRSRLCNHPAAPHTQRCCCEPAALLTCNETGTAHYKYMLLAVEMPLQQGKHNMALQLSSSDASLAAYAASPNGTAI